MEPGGTELIPLAVVLSIHFFIVCSKGVIWLLLATTAGLLPVVSLASILSLLFSFNVQVFACLDLNGNSCSLLSGNEKY